MLCLVCIWSAYQSNTFFHTVSVLDQHLVLPQLLAYRSLALTWFPADTTSGEEAGAAEGPLVHSSTAVPVLNALHKDYT